MFVCSHDFSHKLCVRVRVIFMISAVCVYVPVCVHVGINSTDFSCGYTCVIHTISFFVQAFLILTI